ncbi:hypothetical protein [Gimesia maris]|uniref:hypothetical protein n=1 Tax=Gimesia maris TaxID=122 RepID=UPI002420374A|nr:hypothetical protein [Gimesia maris]|tara:strand:- start:1369 stop:1530 length:162 start_codon:yes stop_codon:yes gene_type:complete
MSAGFSTGDHWHSNDRSDRQPTDPASKTPSPGEQSAIAPRIPLRWNDIRIMLK